MSQGVKGCLSWKGAPLFKTAHDFALMPMMLWELKPATIFEIGSGCGASARWYADLMKEFGCAGRVHSVDVKPVNESYDGVEFLRGDCQNPSTLFDARLLATAPKPWLIVEDAHVNVSAVLSFLHPHLAPGDYLVVEDSGVKAADLGEFLAVNDGMYAVDTHFTDFFGRNATCARNSIFRRMS
jgi:cephalosporin hydroxylase